MGRRGEPTGGLMVEVGTLIGNGRDPNRPCWAIDVTRSTCPNTLGENDLGSAPRVTGCGLRAEMSDGPAYEITGSRGVTTVAVFATSDLRLTPRVCDTTANRRLLRAASAVPSRTPLGTVLFETRRPRD